MSLANLKKELKKEANLKQAAILQRFFKTGKNQYGFGDVFLGIKVPTQRKIAKNFYDLSLNDLQNLLNSKYHEFRMVALIILNHKFLIESKDQKRKIFNFYLKNYKNINNWDLVDISAPNIVGSYLLDKPKDIIYRLSKSNNLWKKRIAIIATFNFIRNNKFEDTIRLSQILLNEDHDLINKAVGWMLREVGKRDEKKLLSFLNKFAQIMPRMTLRYSIEKLSQGQRQFYLNK